MSSYGLVVGALYIGLCAAVPGILAEMAVAAWRSPSGAWRRIVGAGRYTFFVLVFYCCLLGLAQTGAFPAMRSIGALFGNIERAIGCTSISYTESLFVAG